MKQYLYPSISSYRILLLKQLISISLYIVLFSNFSNSIYSQDKQFKKLEFIKENEVYLNDKPITNICGAYYQENLWFSIPDIGLCKCDLRYLKLTVYNHRFSDPNSIISNDISDIIEGINGDLWIGTSEGLDKLNLKSGKFRHFRIEAPENDAKNKIRCMLIDHKGIIWLGTNGYGLYRFVPEKERFLFFENESDLPKEFTRGYITTLYEDPYGNMLIGTNNGLYIYDLSSNKLRISKIASSEGKMLSDYEVTFIQQSNKESYNIYWIGTTKGLHQLDLEKDLINSYTTADGMGGNKVCGILNDYDDYLWISTDDGISRFDPSSKEFINYTTYDGLQTGGFIPGACYGLFSGQLFFGGANGLNFFSPREVKIDTTIPSVFLAEIKINGKEFYSNSSPNNNTTFTLPRNTSEITFTIGISDSTLPRISYQYNFAKINYQYNYSKIIYQSLLSIIKSGFHFSRRQPFEYYESNQYGEPTYDRTVVYEDTRGGKYDLFVIAYNRHGIPAYPIPFSIIVQSNIWELIWFRNILLFAFFFAFHTICLKKIAKKTVHKKSWYAWILFTPINFILIVYLSKALYKPGLLGLLVIIWSLGLIILAILAFSKIKLLDK